MKDLTPQITLAQYNEYLDTIWAWIPRSPASGGLHLTETRNLPCWAGVEGPAEQLALRQAPGGLGQTLEHVEPTRFPPLRFLQGVVSTKGSGLLLVEACDSVGRPCGCGLDGSRLSLQMVQTEHSLKEKGNRAILEGIFQEEMSHTQTGRPSEGEVSWLNCGWGHVRLVGSWRFSCRVIGLDAHWQAASALFGR